MLILQAAREVVEEDGFDDTLDSVRDRVDEIESLHRTRELTVREPASASAAGVWPADRRFCTLPVQRCFQGGSSAVDG